MDAAQLEARTAKQQTDAKVAGIVAKLQLLAEKEAKREMQRSKPSSIFSFFLRGIIHYYKMQKNTLTQFQGSHPP